MRPIAWSLAALCIALASQAAARNSANFRIPCDEVMAATGSSQAAGRKLISGLAADRGTAASTNFVLRSGCGALIAAQLAIPRPDAIFSNSFE